MKILKTIIKTVFILMGILLMITNSCKKDDDDITVMDIDGNVYHTIKIGTQVWMLENLKTTRYRNGDPIEFATTAEDWQNDLDGKCCYYNNDNANKDIYGLLYNWYAVDDSRYIAPEGWHVPTKIEWETLFTYLGGEDIAGGKMKETGTDHWNSPNAGATNESGFTGLPGSFRSPYGDFASLGYVGYFWGSSMFDSENAFVYELHYALSEILGGPVFNVNGFSVRCIKD